MAESDDSDNLYQVLQVHSDAEPEVIEAAYRALSKKYHPDRNATDDAQTRMVTINSAYEILGNDTKRAEYDEQRRFEGGIEAPRRSATPPDTSEPMPDTAPFSPPDYAPADSAATVSPDQFDRRARRFVYTYTPARSRASTVWRAILVLLLLTLLAAAILIFVQALVMSGVTLPFNVPRP